MNPLNGLEIPESWDDVTAEWMTAAIAVRHPGAVVSKVEVILRDDGTNRRARLRLTYSSGSGPATVFVKAADPSHAKLNASMGGLFNEPRLFSSAVALPVEHPLAYATVIDEPGLDYILVMEDVTARGGDPRDATRPMTVDQAANGLSGLARLHSAFWGDQLVNNPALDWVAPYRTWPGMGPAIPIALKRLRDTIPASMRSLTAEQILDDYWARFIATLTTSTQTLLHGDPHIGNTYVLPDDVGFLDWQVVRRGNWSLDVGYFLQGAVTEEDRRAHERDLVDEYRSHLSVPVAEQPSAEEAWLRYRASVAHGVAMWFVTAADPGGWQRPEVSATLAQRYAAAFVDLDTPGALDHVA